MGSPNPTCANKQGDSDQKESHRVVIPPDHGGGGIASGVIDPGNEIARRFPYREFAPKTASLFLLFPESTFGRRRKLRGAGLIVSRRCWGPHRDRTLYPNQNPLPTQRDLHALLISHGTRHEKNALNLVDFYGISSTILDVGTAVPVGENDVRCSADRA